MGAKGCWSVSTGSSNSTKGLFRVMVESDEALTIDEVVESESIMSDRPRIPIDPAVTKSGFIQKEQIQLHEQGATITSTTRRTDPDHKRHAANAERLVREDGAQLIQEFENKYEDAEADTGSPPRANRQNGPLLTFALTSLLNRSRVVLLTGVSRRASRFIRREEN